MFLSRSTLSGNVLHHNVKLSIQFLNFTFKPIEPLIDNVFQCINFIIDTIDRHRLKNPTVNRSKCDRPGSKRQCRDRTTVKPIVLTVSKTYDRDRSSLQSRDERWSTTDLRLSGDGQSLPVQKWHTGGASIVEPNKLL